ncbi:diacylglycerol kinase family protein [Roseomonas sp. KE0001]|uniref:diacylglycerol/lipid kinase family protein n=1 Tax=Roseomonas sp. KE0001 TaxID=2479201 RepID=UPI0018E01632|nr:diacylglycerol kinase family protein [Roseomonas sp. KE0001]MBI0433853.1 hypothetical protein [Roseomonas sp. KE0001]
MKATLFHNPSAGDEDHSTDSLARLLCRAGLPSQPHATRGNALEDGLQEESGMVIVAGGDGTVGKIAARLPRRDRPLAILPLGTANNLARAMGRWASPEAFADQWRQAEERRLAVAFAEGPWGCRRFVEAAGFGAFAEAVQEADRQGLEGVAAGRAAFRAILRRAEPVTLRLEADGQPREVETLLVEVMNIPLFGPNLPLAPEADPGDGLLDLVTLAPERREAMLRWLERPDKGKAPTDVQRAGRIVIEWPGGPCRLDDECVSREAPMRVVLGIEEERLRVLVPPAAERNTPDLEPDTGQAKGPAKGPDGERRA